MGIVAPMSNSTWCDSNNKGELLKLHIICPKSKRICQKLISFPRKQFQIEGFGIENVLRRTFKVSQKAWEFFSFQQQIL